MAIKAEFKIGHSSKLRTRKTSDGFTHDWELYVQGVNKSDISIFVEKVVFNLHDSFPKPKRVCKEPPYVIQESGYAGFLVPIDIYFRNRDELKRIQFTYDLDLQQSGAVRYRSEIKKYVFENPSEEFRQKLLKGGCVPMAAVLSGAAGVSTTSNAAVGLGAEAEGLVSKPKLSSSEASGSKKHKSSRSDDAKMSTFENLFGTNATKSGATKHSPDGKGVSGGKAVPGSGGGANTPTAATGAVGNNTGAVSVAKEGKTKDKDRSAFVGGADKVKEKPERKEKHKQASPHKDARITGDGKKASSVEVGGGKEKRADGETKAKKDKSRDKERERSREKGGGANKRTLSPKTALRELGAPSPKRASPPPSLSAQSRPTSAAGARMEEGGGKAVAGVKAEPNAKGKDSKVKDSAASTSSGKKSKKEKKDKERERDKEKRGGDDHKEKHRTAEAKTKGERANSSNAAAMNLNTDVAGGTSELIKDPKAATSLGAVGGGTKRGGERDNKADGSRGKAAEKPAAKEIGGVTPIANYGPTDGSKKSSSTSSSSNAIEKEKDKKTHKHKKKDKNKEKERDKERDRDKEKEKKDKDKEKADEKVSGKQSDKNNTPAAAAGNNSNSSSAGGTSVSNMTTTGNNSSSSRKSQNKERKSKDKSSKEEKRLTDLAAAASSDNAADVKHPSKHGSKNANNNNSVANSNNHQFDLSDVDSMHSSHDLTQTTATSSSTATTSTGASLLQNSDSSNSSFPDLPVVPKASQTLPPPSAPKALTKAAATASLVPSPSRKETKASAPPSAKEHTKQRNAKGDKAAKPDKVEKPEKPEKETKKRRRNSVSKINANSGSTPATTFIEPPLKQMKREPTKLTREKSKSPSLRSTVNSTSAAAAATITANANSSASILSSSASPSPAASIASANNAALAPPLHPASPALAADAVSNAGTMGVSGVVGMVNASANMHNNHIATGVGGVALPTDYLSELQELHNKITALQDNDELQRVVELIASTGCYELTQRTFDFDLCRLDRTTVQMLQDFFAGSVS